MENSNIIKLENQNISNIDNEEDINEDKIIESEDYKNEDYSRSNEKKYLQKNKNSANKNIISISNIEEIIGNELELNEPISLNHPQDNENHKIKITNSHNSSNKGKL